jgi:hypothetical protein
MSMKRSLMCVERSGRFVAAIDKPALMAARDASAEVSSL